VATEGTEAIAATDEVIATADTGEAVGSAEETIASADEAVESGDEAMASADAEIVDAARAETEAASEAAADAAAEHSSTTSHDDAGTFLGELVRAMRTTVGAERTRIAADIEHRRSEHLAAIQARRESEAQKMHELAADDLKAIDGWAEEERQRIRRERERRATELSDDLKKSLAEHGSRIDREVEAVEATIAAHRVEVDAFFAELDRETDPVEIAQRAGRRPVFPALDSTGADGASAAAAQDGSMTASSGAADQTPVAVMDANSDAKTATPFAGWNRPSSAAPAASPDSTSPSVAADAEAPVASSSDASATASDTILHAVPSGRPLGWLRRSNDSSDRPNG